MEYTQAQLETNGVELEDKDIVIEETLIVLGEDNKWCTNLHAPSSTTDDLGGQHAPNSTVFKQLGSRTNWLKSAVEANANAITELDSALTSIDLSKYALANHTHNYLPLTGTASNSDKLNNLNSASFARYAQTWHSYSVADEADTYITEENVFGDTAIGVGFISVEIRSVGNTAFISVAIELNGFSIQMPRDDPFSFKYDVLQALKKADSTITGISSGNGSGEIMFYQYGVLDTVREVAKTSISSDGRMFFLVEESYGRHQGGYALVNRANVKARYIVRVER